MINWDAAAAIIACVNPIMVLGIKQRDPSFYSSPFVSEPQEQSQADESTLEASQTGLDAKQGDDSTVKVEIKPVDSSGWKKFEPSSDGKVNLSEPWGAIADEPNAGETFDERFEIEALLGRGGMSKVYKAIDTRLKRVVAIKVLHPHLLEREESVQRFHREARSISDLKHDGVVQVFELGLTRAKTPYIVMEYLEGAPFNTLIEGAGKLTYDRAVPLFLQIAEALDYAHGKGVVHRDLKPGNIIIRKKADVEESVCIVDFGLAKFMPNSDKDSTSLTSSGTIFGSPPYMSPEQCRGSAVDGRSDLYSMGCLMYEALTGRPPLLGETPVSTVMMQVSDIPESLNKFANVPPYLETVILKSLEKDPANRHQSMTELLAELKNFVNLQKAGLEYKPADLKLQLKREAYRNKKLWMAIAVVAVVGLAVWYWWINEWYGGELVPRLMLTAAIVVPILGGFGYYLYLNQIMKGQDVDSAIPLLAWFEPERTTLKLEVNHNDGREDLEKIFSLSGGASGADQPLSKVKEAFERLISQGQLNEAEQRSNDAIASLSQRGEDKSELAFLLKEVLADVHVGKGNYVRAESLYREAVYEQEKVRVFDSGFIQLKLADSIYLQGRFADAQTIYSACLFAINRLGVARDRNYALRLSKLGDCYLNMESFKLAEEQYSSAMALWKELADPVNRSLAFIKYAHTMSKRYMPVKADATFALAVRELKEAFGANSSHHIAAMKLYAAHLWKDGSYLKGYLERKEADKLAN